MVGRPFWVAYAPDDDGSNPRQRRPWMDDPAWEPSGNAPVADVVRFSPDYSADLPLWGISWDDPNLPRDLLVRLTEWQVTFDTHFDPYTGWDSSQSRTNGPPTAALLKPTLGRLSDPPVSSKPIGDP